MRSFLGYTLPQFVGLLEIRSNPMKIIQDPQLEENELYPVSIVGHGSWSWKRSGCIARRTSRHDELIKRCSSVVMPISQFRFELDSSSIRARFGKVGEEWAYFGGVASIGAQRASVVHWRHNHRPLHADWLQYWLTVVIWMLESSS